MPGKISLEGLEFHAYHGVYPHERESGNWFEVDISVETDFTDAARNDELAGTINYESLFRIVKEQMEKPSKLLETVVANIASAVFDQLPAADAVEIRLSKINPPIGGKSRKATVSLRQVRR